MGSNQDPLQRTVVGIIAMVGALLNCALDALIRIVIHSFFLLFSVMGLV